MAENNAVQIDTSGQGAIINGSPKSMYVFFLLKLCANYFEVMSNPETDFQVETATASLIAFCPNRSERERIWQEYMRVKNIKNSGGDAKINASIAAIGELVSYLSDSLEFEEESTGGLM